MGKFLAGFVLISLNKAPRLFLSNRETQTLVSQTRFVVEFSGALGGYLLHQMISSTLLSLSVYRRPFITRKTLQLIVYLKVHCNCIVTRGGVYNEILPEPEGNPKGRARGISRGLMQFFIV